MIKMKAVLAKSVLPDLANLVLPSKEWEDAELSLADEDAQLLADEDVQLLEELEEEDA